MSSIQKDMEDKCKRRLVDYLEWRGIRTSGNFTCLNPDHADSSPSMGVEPDGTHVHCFGCGKFYDVFDLIGFDYGITSLPAQKMKAIEIFIEKNIVPVYSKTKTLAPAPAAAKVPGNQKTQRAVKPELLGYFKSNNVKIDLDELVDVAHKELLESPEALQYYLGRGISMEMIQKYRMGYDALGAKHFERTLPDELRTRSHIAEHYNYILPYFDENGSCMYFTIEISDRSLLKDKEIAKYNGKYQKLRVVAAADFNERYVKQNNPPAVLFVCEGYYDALSVEQMGYPAMALIGVGPNRLLRNCQQYRPDTTFILSLDADKRGTEAIQEIKEQFDSLGFRCVVKQPEGGKDYNECLQDNPEELKRFLDRTVKEVTDVMEDTAVKEDTEGNDILENTENVNVSVNTDKTLHSRILNFQKSMKEFRESSRPTGFAEWDKLTTGLHPGIFMLVASTGVGKTTWMWQIAEHLTETGTDVMYFPLEQGANDLIAKSITRKLYLQGNKTVTETDVREGSVDVTSALQELDKTIGQMTVIEGNFRLTAADIINEIKSHIELTGIKPVVFVDYLQLIKPDDAGKLGNREVMEGTADALCEFVRDSGITLFMISSTARSNYWTRLDVDALKETGKLEYDSDAVWTLEFQAVDEELFDVDTKIAEKKARINAEKSKPVRKMQMRVIKTRFGNSGGKVKFDYYSGADLFVEKPAEKSCRTEKKRGVFITSA